MLAKAQARVVQPVEAQPLGQPCQHDKQVLMAPAPLLRSQQTHLSQLITRGSGNFCSSSSLFSSNSWQASAHSILNLRKTLACTCRAAVLARSQWDIDLHNTHVSCRSSHPCTHISSISNTSTKCSSSSSSSNNNISNSNIINNNKRSKTSQSKSLSLHRDFRAA